MLFTNDRGGKNFAKDPAEIILENRVHLFYQGSTDKGNSWYITRTEIGFNENGVPYKIGYEREGKV